MGCVFLVNGCLWGLVMLDVLGVGCFDGVDMVLLQVFVVLVVVIVYVVECIDDLVVVGEQVCQCVEVYWLGLEESQGKCELIGQSLVQ